MNANHIAVGWWNRFFETWIGKVYNHYSKSHELFPTHWAPKSEKLSSPELEAMWECIFNNIKKDDQKFGDKFSKLRKGFLNHGLDMREDDDQKSVNLAILDVTLNYLDKIKDFIEVQK